ncbi:DUF2852 domain-containing protein [soil metagenome]
MVGSNALRPGWTPVSILLMVLGFMFFWPLGFIMLAFIIWGDRWGGFRQHFAEMRRDWGSACGPRSGGQGPSGNSAFDDYRAQELRRLDEERQKLEGERREFEDYVRNLRRARDQEEFERFRRERPAKKGGETIDL